MLNEVHEAALGEIVGAAAEQTERRARRRVAEAPEAGAVEREIAAVVLEDRAGRGLRHPGAELDLADAGTGNPDDRRFRHGGCSQGCGVSHNLYGNLGYAISVLCGLAAPENPG